MHFFQALQRKISMSFSRKINLHFFEFFSFFMKKVPSSLFSCTQIIQITILTPFFNSFQNIHKNNTFSLSLHKHFHTHNIPIITESYIYTKKKEEIEDSYHISRISIHNSSFYSSHGIYIIFIPLTSKKRRRTKNFLPFFFLLFSLYISSSIFFFFTCGNII